MQRWEYQVIRLNVEPPNQPAAPPAAGPPQTGGQPQTANAPAPQDSKDPQGQRGPVFSEAYLKEEFPGFYGQQGGGQAQAAQRNAGQAPQDDAGQQLQAYLNGQGQQGWNLVGLQHAGPHTFIIFKRPASADVEAADAQNQQLRLTLEMANRALAIIEKQGL